MLPSEPYSLHSLPASGVLIPQTQPKRHRCKITVMSRNRSEARGQKAPLYDSTAGENQISFNPRVQHFRLRIAIFRQQPS